MTGYAALAHYRYHRGWAGHDLLRDAARTSFDFSNGRSPDLLSGAFYDKLDAITPHQFSGTATLVAPLIEGLLGVHADARNRALSIEPHLPAEWNEVTVEALRSGRDRINVHIQRGRGRYTIALRRRGSAAPLFVRLGPALPLGATVARVRINDADVPVHVEESAHDIHAVVELQLKDEAEIDIEYSGGMEISAPPDALETGNQATALRVLDFRRDGDTFVILVEGVPTASYLLGLRVESRVRSVSGAQIAEQTGDRLQLRIRFGPGDTPFLRKEIRIAT
jgi:hypothetical protein